MALHGRRARALIGLAVAATALGMGAAGCGSGPRPAGAPGSARSHLSPPTTVSVVGAPGPSTGLFRLTLTGAGSHFKAPSSPTNKPYSPNCQALMDPAFAGTCTVASGAGGTVAGVVEEEKAELNTQERDLVWRRSGSYWSLALVHVVEMCRKGLTCTASPGLPTLLWRDDVARDGRPDLVFVLPTDRPGYGNELDVVDEAGKVTLVRYLGQGFVDVPPGGGIVTYVPGATEATPADGFFDQTLIGYSAGRWRVFSEQYVPYAAPLAQHRGAFSDPRAVASGS